MTTPDTAAVRAWARKNGHDVADRGRLPAELHAAYLAAEGGTAAPARKPARATSAQKAAPARKRTATKAAPTKRAASAAAEPVADAPPDVQPDRLGALEDQVAALSARVVALEERPAAPATSAKPSLFRRRNS